MPGCDSNIDYFNLIKSNINLDATSNSNKTNVSQKITLDDILNTINFSIEEKYMIMQGSKKKYLVPYKIEFIKAAHLNKYSLVEISKFINTTPDALRKFRNYYRIIT